MNEFGNFSLGLAWLLALFGFVAGIYLGRRNDSRGLQALANSTILCTFCTFIAISMLAMLFLFSDMSNQYVWQHSNHAMEWYYKISALWGGMDGSMLLWCFMLSLSAAIVALRVHRAPAALMPWVLSIVNSALLFFLTVVFFLTNPFRYIKAPFIPPDGNGLNPLLQNPYMAIHPPMLYAGFTTFTIPFAFCIGALLANRLDNEWIRLTRRWTLVAWCFLTTGIVLGGHWAYVELGWGGFWAWDPVENASFLPWLTGTAFLHSVMVQERKNMLKFWNVWLVVLTFGLTVFGTFLTRSGVVQSVHAFAETKIGWVFLTYLGVIFLVTLILTLIRRKELRSERKIESFLSREAFFLLNNLVFLSICFATLWGVLFPILSEKITGHKQTVSIPFFNAVNVPLFLLLILLMGVGPLIAWRKAPVKSLFRTFVWPALSAVIVGAILIWAGVAELSSDHCYPLLSYVLCVFVTGTILSELHRGMRVQIGTAGGSYASSAARVLSRHRVRFGGYLVHFGVVVATVAITSAMAFKTEREFTLTKGQTFELGRFTLTLLDLGSVDTGNYQALLARTEVRTRDGEVLGVLEPELRNYARNDETTTEVALRVSPREDLYLVVAGLDENGTKASFKAFINPLQMWLWVGSVLMVIGGVIVLLPRYGMARSPALAGEELEEQAMV